MSAPAPCEDDRLKLIRKKAAKIDDALGAYVDAYRALLSLIEGT